MLRKYLFRRKIIPDKLICISNFYKIILIDSEYIINKFEVYVDETRRVKKILIVNGKHPNCDPETNIFCLPDSIKDRIINVDLINIIVETLKIFNYNSSYYQDWGAFKCIKEGDDKILWKKKI